MSAVADGSTWTDVGLGLSAFCLAQASAIEDAIAVTKTAHTKPQ